MMALDGHSAAQVPHPEQAATVTMAGLLALVSTVIAPKGQTLAQIPQEVHASGITSAVIASTRSLSGFIKRTALAAAADAWVTESLISLGPSAQPAKKIPRVAESTGWSLGWASR